MPRPKVLAAASYVTVAITLVLFIAALFVKGFTHDLLLEAGVFLVSAKLVINGEKTAQGINSLREELQSLRSLLENSFAGRG